MLRGGDETPCSASASTSSKRRRRDHPRVLTAVRRTFITPFDRGDIKNLITAMDDAIDQMQQTARQSCCSRCACSSRDARDGAIARRMRPTVERACPLLKSIGDNVSN